MQMSFLVFYRIRMAKCNSVVINETFVFTIFSALEEAKDIVRYLQPLQTHFKLLEETDFGDIAVCLSPLMHVVCLVWSNSRFYCSSNKIIVLLKQICNLLIAQVNFKKKHCEYDFWVAITTMESVTGLEGVVWRSILNL